MRKIFFAALILVSFYVHARMVFSEPRLNQWVADHSARAMAGNQTACEDFSSDVLVSIHARSTGGVWEVEGGKDEVCGYLRQSSAALTVLQASVRTSFENVKIERSGFPWLTAKVQYTEKTSVSAERMPSMQFESRETLVVERTVSGIKIKALTSEGSQRK